MDTPFGDSTFINQKNNYPLNDALKFFKIMKKEEIHTLMLKLVALEKASFKKSGSLIEFCFKGMRYSISNFDFERTAHVIGTDSLKKELESN